MRALAVIATLAAAGLMAADAAAQPLVTAGATSCKVRGWVQDPDPKGTNVRSAPRANAPIIGHLAPMVQITKDERTGVEFDIVGSKDGWLLIQNGSDGGLTFDAAHATDGRGWITARFVSAQMRAAALRSAPSRDAPQIARMAGDNWAPYSAGVLAVHSCNGRYMELTALPVGGKPVRGWSFAPCSLQLTTCDGGVAE